MTVAERYFDALSRADIDTALACFTEDAVYHDLLLGPASGHGQIRTLLERMTTEVATLSITPDRTAGDGGIEFAEWTCRYILAAPSEAASGTPVTFRGVSVLETVGGRCFLYREHFNVGKLLLDMGLDAPSLHTALSRTPVGAARARSGASTP